MKFAPIKPVLLVPAILLLSACNAIKPFYKEEVRSWASNSSTDQEVVHTLFLIGDVGEPELEPLEPALKSLRFQLEEAGKNSTVVFLGDNIYPDGLPPHDEDEEKSKDRLVAESKLKGQLDILDDFKGQPFFIPGNHDWNKSKAGGLERVEAQSEFVEDYLDRGDTFRPDPGCPGPSEVELTDDLVLLMIDSEWFLYNWEKEPDMNDGCEVLSRDEFLVAFEAAIERNEDKDIIIAMHHPLYTQGSHGGYYRFKDHLFPLTDANKKLWIPLPVLGSVYPIYRQSGGVAQDDSHPKYQDLKEGLLNAVKGRENVIFASGHEHSLAYYHQEDHHFIVSGAGCKNSPLRKGKKAVFAHSATGFSKVFYHDDGSIWMEFWEPSTADKAGLLVFRHKLRGPKPSAPEEAPEVKYGSPSISAYQHPGFDEYKANGFKRFLLGTHYREEWATGFEVPVIDLKAEYGGLKPVQKGGGFQTKSLRLENPDGKQYVLRSVNKNVRGLVPKFLDDTFAEDVMQDQVSNAHPYAALIVPTLADAAGVYHTNPKIVWLAPQDALGQYLEGFANDLYLYEERPDDDRSDVASFGRSEDITSFTKVIHNTQKHYDHLIDQEMTARARIFDFLINDWDRHDDQWRWATFKEDGRTIYQPIPRDRDQALHHKFSGVLPVLSQINWGLRKFQSFQPQVKSIKGLSFNARFFDRAFLNELERADFLKISGDIQHSVTDAVIDSAFAYFPDTIYSLKADRLSKVMKARRDNLQETADRFYELLARKVDIVGTNKDDFFDVKRMDNGDVRVRIYEREDGKDVGDAWFDRTLVKKETKEIRLYGLKGKDEFKIKGEASKSILVRVIGGKSHDKVDDESRVGGLAKKTKVYDKSKGMKINEGARETKFIAADKRPELNEYDRRGFLFHFSNPLIEFGVNVDDGLLLGGGIMHVRNNFKKKPYSASHILAGKVSARTGSFSFRYQGDITEAIGRLSFAPQIQVNAPNFARNFFGLGNDTEELVDRQTDRNFYLMRIQQIGLSPLLRRSFKLDHFVEFGPTYQYSEVESKANRFINIDNEGVFQSSDFDAKHYAGGTLRYYFSNVKNKVMPERGIRFLAEAGWNANLDSTAMNYTRLASEFSMYFTFHPIQTTLASRVGVASNLGDFEFFQANTLGGSTNLRGHRNFRYAGETAFYHNTELRIKLTKISNYILSSSLGILGHMDHGRIWQPGENSDNWHFGYGGGVWLSLFDVIVLTGTYTFSDQDQLFLFRGGFLF